MDEDLDIRALEDGFVSGNFIVLTTLNSVALDC